MNAATWVKRTFKYLLYLLLLMVCLLVSLFFVVIHTESGSRFAIEQGIEFADINLSYDSINGNLSKGLVINNLNYQDQAIEIKINNIKYSSSWSWLNRHLELADVLIDEVTVITKSTAETSVKKEAFAGVKLPLSIDVQSLLLNQLTLVENTAEALPMKIEQIELKALLQAQSAEIKTIKVKSTEYEAVLSGSVDYGSDLSYALQTAWQIDSDGQSIQAIGPIQGDLNSIKLQQDLNLKSDVIQGHFVLAGEVFEWLNSPAFNFQLSAQDSQLVLQQQPLEFTQLQAVVDGSIDKYHVSLESQFKPYQLKAMDLPAGQIKLNISGNTQSLTTKQAQIITPEGVIDLQAEMNWNKQFELSSQLTIDDFNPQQLLQEWPGLINGQVNLKLAMTEQGMIIKTKNNALQGQLKGQPFKLSGSANYASNTFSAEQLRIDLADNYVVLNGQVNEQNVSLNAALNWVDLSLIDSQLAGHVEGTVALSGSHLNPQIKAALKAQKLTYADYQIATLNLTSHGKWNDSLTTEITAEYISFGSQVFDEINVRQSGWLNQHEVEISINNSEISSLLKLDGQLDIQATGKKPLWQGQVVSHELIVETDKKIQLQAPISIAVADHIRIGAGCWQGVEAGTLCIELNDIKTDNNYQGNLSVNAFSLIPLQAFLPENIELKGRVKGDAMFLYQADELKVEANLSLEAGELIISNEQAIIYQTAIDKFEINAKTTQQNIDVMMVTQIADSSYLNVQANIENSVQIGWQINSSIEGVFQDSALLQNLSEEIKELKGKISIDGTINGALLKPNIQFNLTQPDGYLVLTRLGTVIENLALSVVTEGLKQPIYNIIFSGKNSAEINQGEIASAGELSLLGDNQWQYVGEVTGDNFMLLNLPEAKFNISPKLTVLANQKLTDIKGELIIDSGHVTVKQLPASTVSNSGDLEVHTTTSTDSVKYPINMNILAKIKDPVELDVIGLVADLSGSLQLTQAVGQPLAAKGILRLSDGSYEIYGQKLSINQGEMTFTGPLDNPRLNVKASRQSISGDVVAGVELGGTVNNLQSNLYSEPNLSDLEKLSYIMSGRGMDNSGNLSAEQLKQAAIVMGLNQSSPIFNQIQNQFGIDVLTLHESAVAADTVVEAGKKVNDKLYISYNQGLFNRLGFWMIKYKINQFLNLETTQGEDQSVELVYVRKADVKKTKEKETDK